ncbi:MAG TPA: amylo-alpha-1,6-glucosidase, partial [Polyangia bacterium]|nr:amylo-alpha-1,6-glucosidase [Polyangia bacterium]
MSSGAPARRGWHEGESTDVLLGREWLLTNGLGGYASGTIGATPTRRSHGLLIAALPAPLGRTLMLNHLLETLIPGSGPEIRLSGVEGPASALLPEHLVEFWIDNGRPIWRFEHDGIVLEKRIVVTYRQNTTRVSYRLIAAPGPVTLRLEPAVSMRSHEGRVDQPTGTYLVKAAGDGVEVTATDGTGALPALRLQARTDKAVPMTMTGAGGDGTLDVIYRIERSRGYEWRGPLRRLGQFELTLPPGGSAHFTASTEAWEGLRELDVDQAMSLDDERRQRLIAQAHAVLQHGLGAELVLAADQFIITPRVRPADEARLHAEGDEARTIIAGYPWFTDWGRDTMISLEGLTLLTGRQPEARSILHTFAKHIRDGLIPNLFPEGETEGLYHTADATLWFFHALDRYERSTGDADTRRFLMPKLVDIVEKHLAGTRFGIGLDPADGLLRQGAPGYQLTWMDAKVGDWVVTPRRGKAVEINALFYNALMLLGGWLADEEAAGRHEGWTLRSETVVAAAARLRESFNRRFWNPRTGCLFDVLDGEPDRQGSCDDASIRPNQVLAISLPHAVLDTAHWVPVLNVVREQLATPFGLRSLAPGHPDFKPRYDGDLRARDAAYHQGTIWGWLIGPFVDAWLKAFPDDRHGARRLLDGVDQELSAACIGTISEIFDAEPPFLPRGCTAQAWSVAEVLRAIVRTSSPL